MRPPWRRWRTRTRSKPTSDCSSMGTHSPTSTCVVTGSDGLTCLAAAAKP